MQLEDSLPGSQESANGRYSETVESNRHSHALFSKIHSHLSLGLPRDIFPWGFPIKILYECLISLTLVHSILLFLNTLVIFCKNYKLWSSSLGNFLRRPVCSCLFGPNIIFTHIYIST
jgi:hypothetical protein